MVVRLDRIQLAVHDRKGAAERWARLFASEVVREDRVEPLAARRTVLRVGESEIELLSPDGIGALAQHIARSRSALFAVGLSVDDLEATRARLDASAVHHVVHHHQILLTGDWLGVPGLRVVLSPEESRAPAGLLGRIYEATHLMRGCERGARRLAEVFELDASGFVPIRSEPFGYDGWLAMLRPDRIDRIETITPTDRSKPMGRFFLRQGPCLYMFYVEARDTAAIRERLREHAPDLWTGPAEGPAPDNLFVHPRALDGALLGISRETVAWMWSGHPERVRPAA